MAIPPPFPEGRPARFRATIHGTVFGGRERHLDTLGQGDPLRLVPDPPVQDPPGVWVHVPTGEPIGHLPPDIAGWLWPWLVRGGTAKARAVRVEGDQAPSWRRLLVEVECSVE